MTRRTAPCTLRALRELGYRWVRVNSYDRLESWILRSLGELDFSNVYWNGDGHDVRLIVGYALKNEASVDQYRGPTRHAVRSRAMAIMAKFRADAEKLVIMDPEWQVTRGGGGDARQHRKARRRAVRLIANAREEARKAVAP